MFNPRPLTTEETNPILSGIGIGIQNQLQQALARQQSVTAQYAPQMAQQGLLKEQLANMLQKPRAQLAGPLAQAELQKAQMEPKLYGAQIQEAMARIPLIQQQAKFYGPEAEARIKEGLARGQLTQYQADLLRRTMKAQEQKATLDLFQDPLLKRMAEYQAAQTTGSISPETFQQFGLGGQSQQQQIPGQTPQLPGNQSLTIQPDQYQKLAQALGQGGQQQPAVSYPGIANPQTPAMTTPKLFSGDTLQNWGMFGNPLSPVQQAQMEAYKKGIEKKAETDVTNYNEKQKETAEVSDSAIQASRDLDLFNSSYKKLYASKGPVFGRLPGLSSDAQETDKASSRLVASTVRAFQQGRVTDKDLILGKMMTLNRSLNQDAVKTIGDSIRAGLERSKEAQPFFNAAKKAGIDLQTANDLWQKYQEENPLFDPETKDLIPDNLGKWKKYIQSENNSVNQNITKAHVTEENISETMKSTGLSRQQVMQKLKEKGLI